MLSSGKGRRCAGLEGEGKEEGETEEEKVEEEGDIICRWTCENKLEIPNLIYKFLKENQF